jgi:hypothetical protein
VISDKGLKKSFIKIPCSKKTTLLKTAKSSEAKLLLISGEYIINTSKRKKRKFRLRFTKNSLALLELVNRWQIHFHQMPYMRPAAKI